MLAYCYQAQKTSLSQRYYALFGIGNRALLQQHVADPWLSMLLPGEGRCVSFIPFPPPPPPSPLLSKWPPCDVLPRAEGKWARATQPSIETQLWFPVSSSTSCHWAGCHVTDWLIDCVWFELLVSSVAVGQPGCQKLTHTHTHTHRLCTQSVLS